tara:strand:+ start:288 stop:620 length:333 start_codon:yes stop_codon:yes gene_type:complete
MLKNNFDIKILYNFLEKVCNKYNDTSNNYFIIDNTCFKKIEYYQILDDFKKDIEPYYINSKKFYLNRKLDYNKFLTIIRQICKFSNIYYYSKISYDKSKYFIYYYIKIEE